MKDKLMLSDGIHKILWIVKDKVNTSAEVQYKIFDVIKLNKFIIKVVGDLKVVIPNNDFDIVCNEVEEKIGEPKIYTAEDEDWSMEQEFEIPYKVQLKEEPKVTYDDEIEDSEESDVEMKESPAKIEEKVEYHEQEENVEETQEIHEMQPEDDEDDIYTPIKALSTMNSDWIIKARVSK